MTEEWLKLLQFVHCGHGAFWYDLAFIVGSCADQVAINGTIGGFANMLDGVDLAIVHDDIIHAVGW